MKIKNLILCIAFACIGGTISAHESADTVKVDSAVVYSRMMHEKLDKIYQNQNESNRRRSEFISQKKNALRNDERSEFELMTTIADNTREDFKSSGWTLFAVLTFGSSFILSYITYRAQKHTEKHTQNASIKAQQGSLEDLPRHFYRNLVCTTAIMLKYRHGSNREGALFKRYPSESNMLKLQTLPEEFFLSIDVANDNIFRVMHEKKLIFKNYNIEVAVAMEHFARRHITESNIVNDVDNIMFKPLFLIAEVFALRWEIDSYRKYPFWDKVKRKIGLGKSSAESTTNEQYIAETLYTFVKTHIDKLKFHQINTDEQFNMYKEIYKDFDSHIVCGGKNGIERSYNHLFKPDKKHKDTLFLTWSNGKCYIDKTKFMDYLRAKADIKPAEEDTKADTNPAEKGKGDSKGKTKIEIIMDAKDLESLFTTFRIEDERYKECAKSYFDYWRTGDKWEAKSFIYNMLIFDSIKELPIIGMIDHEA